MQHDRRSDLQVSDGQPLRVLIADGQPLYRDALARWLTACRGLTLVAECGDGDAALAQLRECGPDVAIIDRDLPGVHGTRLASIARRDGLPTRVLILAPSADGAAAFRALSCGAAAYLTRDVERDELRAALQAVGAGRVVLPSAVQTGLAGEIRLRHQADRPVLVPRERQILALVAGDRSNADIAEQLHLSVETVKTHLRHVYAKLDVSDRAAAVARAMHFGLLE